MLCLRCGAENNSSADHCVKCKASLRRICPRCRAINHQKQSYCGNCGLKLVNICPRCKALNSPLQKFCGNCGLKILNFCPKCNVNNPINQKFCGNCSTKLFATGVNNIKEEIGQVQSKPPAANTHSPSSVPIKPGKTMTPPQTILGDKPNNLPPQKPKEIIETSNEKNIILNQSNEEQTAKTTALTKNILVEPETGLASQEQMQQKVLDKVEEQSILEKEEMDILKEYSILPKINLKEDLDSNIDEITSFKDSQNSDNIQVEDTIIEREEELISILDESEHETESLILTEDIEPEEAPVIEVTETERKQQSSDMVERFESVDDEIKSPQLLSRFAILSVEIVNYAYLLEKLEKKLLDTIREKIWSNIHNVALNYGEKLILVSDNLGVISFVHSVDLANSSITSIKSAAESLKLMQILNQQILATYNTQIKLKIGIALNDSQGNSEIERSIASEWSIVVSEEIKNHTTNLCNFLPIGPLPIGNKMVSFYKVDLPQVEPQSMDETLIPDQVEQVEVKNEPAIQMQSQKDKISETQQVETEQLKATDIKHLSTNGAVSHFLNVCHITNSSTQGQLISLVAEDGYGKSTVLKSLKSSIAPESFIWMTSRCNFQEHLIPLSAIKNLLRSFFGLSNYALNKEEIRSIVKGAVESLFGQNDQLVFLFNSILLEDPITGVSNQIIVNSLYNLIKRIGEKVTPVIIIEDIEFIDKSSFEILEAMLSVGLTNTKALVIFTHQPSLNFNEIKPNLINSLKYSQVVLQKADKENIDYIVQEIAKVNINLPSTIKDQLINATQGVPLAVESALALMNDLEVLKKSNQGPVFNEEAINWQVPESFQGILGYLFTRISQSHPDAFVLLQQSAILGPKISYKLLEEISNQVKNFENELQTLFFFGYLTLEDTNTIIFKHNLIWEFVYYACITDEVRPQKHLEVLNHLEQIIESGGYVDLGYLAYQSEMSGKKKKSLNYWNQLANHNLSIGMLTGYTDVMIHYLTLLDETDLYNRDEYKIRTLEGIASVAYSKQPDLAIQCLSSIIPVYEQANDLPKLIEARGYLSYCYENLGKWDEAILEIDKAIEVMPENTMVFDRILLQVSKLSPLLSLGKNNALISLCNEVIFPAVESALINKSIPANISEDQLFSIYVSAKMNYTNALIEIGSSDALAVFDSIKQQLESKNMNDTFLHFMLINARSLTEIGDVKKAESLLSQSRELISKSSKVNMLWNLWGKYVCYNCLETGNYDLLLQIINAIKSQPENQNDITLVAVIKYCDANIEEAKNNIGKAKELFNDLINYASNYKLASFALEGWYHMSYLDMKEKRFDSAENIANRALEIANMDGIRNIGSIAKLNRLLGEIKIRTGELTTAKEYLDNAIKAATSLHNPSLSAKISLTLGYLFIEMITHFEENKLENANKAKEYLLSAHNTFSQFGNKFQLYPVEKAIENLSMVAKVNSIAL